MAKDIRSDTGLYSKDEFKYDEKDQSGALKITKTGLAQRNRFIFQTAHKTKIPIAVTLGGGYARRTQDVVDIHCQTARSLKEIYKTTDKH